MTNTNDNVTRVFRALERDPSAMKDMLRKGEDEVITFSHRAYSRALFGKGAVAAAKFLAGKGPGMYSMADVIG